MLKTGLCSVTFRKLTPEQIVELAVKAGIEGIEWGSDIHVPAGQLPRAEEIANFTEQAGLNIVSYGSYYRAGESNRNDFSFEEILQTAASLRAPTIRVWAGHYGSNEADESYRQIVIYDARRIASLAREYGISINFEYHGGTLTDTKESARRLMEQVGHDNIGIYWQPAVGQDICYRIESLKRIQSWLTHVHVFHWEGRNRLPLIDGEQKWEQYVKLLSEMTGERYMMLEFVKDDDQEQFLKDAGTLKQILDFSIE